MAELTDHDKRHRRNLTAIAKQIELIFRKAAEEAALIGVSLKAVLPEDEIFSFDDYPQTRKQIKRLLATLSESTDVCIANGVRSAWTLSNNKNNALARRVFGNDAGKLTKEQNRRYFSNNEDALQAFMERKEQGLELSDRVWRYAEAFKHEIELGLDLGIRSGKSASAMARELQQYLKHPDKLFRRVRETHGTLRLSKAAAAFHPGRGVYRSSYRNARRLAVTETNIAYRTADHLRWQQMDFVVGIEIKLSGNHTVEGRDGKVVRLTDICDRLKGRYPKDFKFTGWHPNCRCVAVPILKTEQELMEDTGRILDGEEPVEGSVRSVSKVPSAFTEWVKENEGRIEGAETLPYFVRDNRAEVEKALEGKEISGNVTSTNISSPKSNDNATSTPTQTKQLKKNKSKTSESEPSTPYMAVDSIEKAIERAKTYGISFVDFSDASIDEINTVLEVFHYAHQNYGINLFELRLGYSKELFNKKKNWAGSYNSDTKILSLELSAFRKSEYLEPKSYTDKIARLQSNKASLLRQIEQSEARLGRSKASDRILKGDIKTMRSKMHDIDLKIQKYEELIKDGYKELPLTVAESFKEIKDQIQARIWHEIGHHIDDRIGRPKFKEGNFISEYSKEMRDEEFAEWFSHYNMRGAKNVPSDLLRIFRKEEYKRYGERKWEPLYFDEKSGGYNVAHDLHQFKNTKPKGVPRTGGEAEQWLGEQLAKQGKAVEFMPESGISGKAGDMRFDGKVWDCKYIPLANESTIRTCFKDAKKADCVIFTTCGEVDRFYDIINAIDREVGRYKSQGRNIDELPDVYVYGTDGKLELVKKIKGT